MARAIPIVVFTVMASSASASQEPVRIGAISLAYIARSSKAGQSALAEIEKFVRLKEAESAIKAAQLDTQRLELQKTAAGLSPRAVGDLQKAFDKARVEFERFQQDAQAEIERMQARFDAEFRVTLAPVIDQISKEKGLHFVFGLEQAAIVWWTPAVDISEEVVKRLDTNKK